MRKREQKKHDLLWKNLDYDWVTFLAKHFVEKCYCKFEVSATKFDISVKMSSNELSISSCFCSAYSCIEEFFWWKIIITIEACINIPNNDAHQLSYQISNTYLQCFHRNELLVCN